MNKKEEYRTRKVLLKLGISASLRGQKYILLTLAMLESNNKIRMGEIYNNIYKTEKAKSTCDIERGLRYAIEKSYNEKDTLKNIYGKKPKVKEFLYDLLNNIDIFEEELKE